MYCVRVQTADGSDRLTWIDLVRGVAIVLVIVLHAGLALDYFASSYPEPIRIFNDVFEPFRMPTLMFLSGLFVARSLAKGTATYFRGKARKIAWPYLVWSILSFIAAGDLGVEALTRMFYNPIETHLWYLWFLAIFYALAWLLRKVPAWIPGAIALGVSQFVPEDFRLEKGFFLFGFFMFGIAYAANRHRVDRWAYSWQAAVLAIALSGAASVLNVNGVKVLYEPAYALCVFGFILLAARIAPHVPRTAARRVFEEVGRNSIVYYVSHLLVIKVVATILSAAGFDSPWLMFPILLLSAFGVGRVIVWSQRVWLARWLFEWNPPHRVRAMP